MRADIAPLSALLVCGLLVSSGNTLVAQKYIKIDVTKACSYYGDAPEEELVTFAPDKEALDFVASVTQTTGIPQNFTVLAGNVRNALAHYDQATGARQIVYSQEFMRAAVSGTDKWPAISVMAHEIGHHIINHPLSAASGASKREQELEADNYSGHVLRQMNATLEQAREAMERQPDVTPRGYPDKSTRLAAIQHGWIEADEQIKGRAGATANLKQEAPTDIIDAVDAVDASAVANLLRARRFPQRTLNEALALTESGDIARLLLGSGASASAAVEGVTPLCRAVSNRLTDLLSVLVKQKGIDIHQPCDGDTPLNVIIKKWGGENDAWPEGLRLLRELPGFDVNEPISGWQTYVAYAVSMKRWDLVQLLIAIPGINLNTSREFSPADSTCLAGQIDILRTMVRLGAKGNDLTDKQIRRCAEKGDYQ